MSPKVVLILGVALAACTSQPGPDPVNTVVGDASWIAAHGEAPTGSTDEIDRVRTHLRWAAATLTAHEPAALTLAARANRRARLAELVAYADAGAFPILDAPRAHRVPRFRDREGTWCAVGGLVASTDPALAELIAARYEYARIAEMTDPRLDAWATAQGFTRTELAMIQPEYGFVPRCNGWGNQTGGAEERCPDKQLRDRRVALDFGFGGGATRADGADQSYFLWGAAVRVAITAWLSLGVGDLGVRVGHDDATGNHVALVATPLVELSHWDAGGYGMAKQYHLDLGLTTERVFADRDARAVPYAAQVAFGFRLDATDVASVDFVIGAAVALVDGFVVGDTLGKGGIAPFVRVGVGWRP